MYSLWGLKVFVFLNLYTVILPGLVYFCDLKAVAVAVSSHTRSVLMAPKQVSGRGQNSTHRNTKTHQNWQAWLRPGWHPAGTLVAIGLGVSAPQILDFAMPFDVSSFFSSFFGFFSNATAYTLEPIFTKNTSTDVFPGNEVYLIFRPLNFWKNAILGTDFDRTFLRPKTALTWGFSNITTLNRRRSPIKVV